MPSFGSRKRKLQLQNARQSQAAKRQRVLDSFGEATPASPIPESSVPASHFSASSTPVTSTQTELPVSISASKSKLSLFPDDNSASSDYKTGIVQFEALQPLFQNFSCTQCGDGTIKLIVNNKKSCGFASHLELTCGDCGFILSSCYTSLKCEDNRGFDINRRTVAASLATGMGHAGMGKFFELINIPNLHQKTYSLHAKYIHSNHTKYTDKLLAESHEKVRQAYPEQKDKPVIDIDVSYDGSWHKRGHTSKTGIGCIIENRTGLVVDYHCMSKYCQQCATTGERLKAEGMERYNMWFASHQPSCDINHKGSSGSMEQEGALTMWGRSERKYGLRYRSVISDGDTNTIKVIHEADPYQDLKVIKMECVNHVAKRLGKALRTLVDTKKKQKITLGGRGEGRLTQEKMNKLQKYYTKAVRAHNNVTDMKRAIWATFWHCTSTDKEPHHHDCPPGETSWCFFQKAKAKNLSVPSHSTHMNTYLNPLVAEHVKEVYERMTDEDLLRRCVDGKTQNVNECIHSLIWSRCPKHIFVNKPRLEVSVSVGVGEFNMGSKASRDFMVSLGLPIGDTMKAQGLKRDNTRVRKSECAVQIQAKR